MSNKQKRIILYIINRIKETGMYQDSEVGKKRKRITL